MRIILESRCYTVVRFGFMQTRSLLVEASGGMQPVTRRIFWSLGNGCQLLSTMAVTEQPASGNGQKCSAQW
jgi:hypothetical protein